MAALHIHLTRVHAGQAAGFGQWDFTLIKDTSLTERVKLQFRTDFFNIINHPNFANPDSVMCLSVAGNVCTPNTNFGRSGSTIGTLVGIGTSRQLQFALKLLF